MADVVVLEAAAADYAAALRWYAERSVAAATGFETAISQAIEAIALQPLWYPACDERHRFVMVRGSPYQLSYRLDSPDSLVVVHAGFAEDPLVVYACEHGHASRN